MKKKGFAVSGEMLVFLGAVFWSLNAPLITAVQNDALPPFLVCGLRALIAGIVLAPFIRPSKIKMSKWLVMYVLSYAGLSICLVTSLKLTSAAIAIGMQYTALIWFFLLSMLRKDAITWRGTFPVALILMGVALFMLTGSEGGNLLGNCIALLEGVCFTGMTIGAKRAAPENPLGLLSVSNLFTAAIVMLFILPFNGGFVPMTALHWGVMLTLGIVQVGFGYGLYNLGLRRVTPQKASVLAIWEMILGPIWVALFLHEYPTTGVWIGFAIIIVGIILNAWLNAGGQKNAAAKQQ